MLRQRLKARREVPVIGGSIPPLAIYLILNALRRFAGIDLYGNLQSIPCIAITFYTRVMVIAQRNRR
jgi:hypothetical protein